MRKHAIARDEMRDQILAEIVRRARIVGVADELLVEELCVEDEPSCESCPMRPDCVTGQEARREVVSAGRGARPKPR